MVNSLDMRPQGAVRREIDGILILSVLFSVGMEMARILYTRHLTFISMTWNLFLAWLPYALTQWLARRPQWIAHRWKFAGAFVVWLLFIPNSFYILTDLFHLGDRQVPMWYDLALLLSFAWNGLLLGVLSVRRMEQILETRLGGQPKGFFLYPVMLLNAFGIYIGRYLRFNSWDVLTNPFSLLADTTHILLHPVYYKHAWGMILCYAVFMTLIYQTLKKIGSSIA